MRAVLLLLTAWLAAAAAQQRILVTYSDADVSINDTQIATLPAPAPPPGLQLVYDLALIGIQVYEITDPGVSIDQACGDLEDSDEHVSSCEGDATVSIDAGTAKPSDALFSQQYVFQATNALAAWQQGYFGDSSIKACSVDTGLDTTHPDLAANVGNGTAFLNGAQSSNIEDANGHG